MNLNGVILIDKTSGPTSHDVVDDLRKILKTKAVGHGGTLDPLATGLLICMIGDATKLSQYVMNEEKSYVVGVKLGVRTDSGDITGKVIEEKSASEITRENIEEVLPLMKGSLDLQVPLYSAIKVNGKKLYEYARKNEDIEIPVKTMTIHEINFLEFSEGHAQFEIRCEKGTYIRSWVEELGRRLGTGATVESLRRTRSGGFDISQAKTVEALLASDENSRESAIIPLQDVLGQWPALKVTGRDHSLVMNGQIPKGIYSQVLHFNFNAGIRVLNPEGGLLALIVRDAEKGIKLARVFNQ